jgi:cysteine desulfurase
MDGKRVYLDNAATTPVAKEVWEAMMPYYSERYGNASSLHSYGREAKDALEESRAKISKKLNASPEELVFTSGGTESNNLALKGIAQMKGIGHIITCRIEHSAILAPCRLLEKQGFTVTYLDVDKYGTVDPPDVEKALRDDTILVSIGHANNEIGTVQDLEAIGKITKERGVLFHTDACQSFTKESINVKKQHLDLVTINSHKIYGPKGVGALFIRDGVKIASQSQGGEHERNLRAGTENVPGIVGFTKAAEITGPKENAHVKSLRDRLIGGILSGVEGVRLNGHPEKRLSNNTNFLFKGIEGEAILLRLDMRGIACSTGSACSSHSLMPSHVLLATGLAPEECHGSLRMTLGRDNTVEDIDYAIESVKAEVANLRKISPFWRK